MSQAPPRGSFARGSILGAAVARASAKKAQQVLAQPFRNANARHAAQFRTDEEIAKILFDTISVLRGTPLKLAQVLATEPELIPAAYRKQFSRASHDVTPISRALVWKTLSSQLGEPADLFRDFDDVPFAAASLGQVHAATSHDAQPIAVKIQYPGISDGIASDLRMVRALLAPTEFGKLIDSCFDELHDRLSEELDYTCEAAHTEWFRENLVSTEVLVPRVYRELSTKTILCTERLSGLHLNEWLQLAPSQEQRNRYGQLLVDLFMHTVFKLGVIHADPNFGNYLFREDGKLGLIDFGCVRRLDAKTVAALRKMYLIPQLTASAVAQLHADVGIQYRTDLPQAQLDEFLCEWAQWLRAPVVARSFNFAENQDFFDQGFRLSEIARRYLSYYDGAFLYFGRAHHGLYRMLQVLGATVTIRIPKALETEASRAPHRRAKEN